MATPFIPPPELLASEHRLQQSIEQFANQLDQNRITIPVHVMDHINASNPDADDLETILAWNGRVFHHTDYYSREAIKAICCLPPLGADFTQWWLDQVDYEHHDDQLYYQQILSSRSTNPTRTTLAAFGIIRTVLSQYRANIPTLADIPRVAGNRLSRILFTYARLRLIASTIADATFQPIPQPSAVAATLAPSHPNLIVDIGRINDAYHMALRQDWMNHDIPPAVCPTCDVWIANDMLDIHHCTDYACPYCWREPSILFDSPYIPQPDDPVDQIFHHLAPPPYSETSNIYRRVAGLSALTPSQAYAVMHHEPQAAANPAPCSLRNICPTDCAQSPLPLTNSGNNENCLIVPFLQRAAGMNEATKTEYAQKYLQNIQDQNASQRRVKAKARHNPQNAAAAQDSTKTREPVIYTQPTLL